uniref:AGAP007178 n=1 Tax=Anopheles coluzzii TaxID=1518534 RepID=A0A0D3QDM3_ANOCL|nr:AGAP007178 [Anopheles coluzzii]AJC98706.1 AGAP007178 [Anopheles coluzzii]AJC98714.1 AGAP007178 [Anopheles coluzzii]
MTSMMSASTADDTTQQSLPSFTSFSAELEPSWDYYEQRPERSNSATNGSTDVIASQTTSNGSYTRPWEMDTKENRMAPPNGPPGTPGPPPPPTPSGFDHGGFPKLPSFQSQFHSFTDPAMVTPEPSLPQVTAVPVPISPSSASPGTGGSLTQLTQLTPTPLPPLPQGGFHTLSAVNSRPYPIVPAAIPVRELAGINHHQHQYIDERHIQLYQPMATFQGQTIPTLAVIKKEMVDYEMTPLNNGTALHHSNFQNPLLDNGLFAQNGTVHHIQHQPTQLQHHLQHHHHQQQQQQQQQQHQTTIIQHQPQLQLHHQHNLVTPSDHHNNNNNNGSATGPTTPSSKMGSASVRLEPGTPGQITRIDNRKKERRKIRAASLESSAESEGSAMEIGESGNPGQVAAISSTANFKSPMHTMSMDTDDGGTPGEKSTKKKRKRCGECVGCSRKDNCGDCAPCRNDKSHQICKTRRCEKLTEKKALALRQTVLMNVADKI